LMLGVAETRSVKTRTIRFHGYGEPSDVLRLEDTELAGPGAKRIRVRVHACGLNPADWALCRGLFGGNLPRGIGLDVSGTVDAVGEGVRDVEVGDEVLGPADFAGAPVAGASDFAILHYWTLRPSGLDPVQAAALPLAVETAFRSIEILRVGAGHTILIHGAGTAVGFAAVQMALMRGARVIATAGETFAERLRALGAAVTSYGDGMVERVLEITGKSPDLILDTAPASGVLPALIKIAGDPSHVLTISDFAAAQELGVRNSFGENPSLRWEALGGFAQLAAEGKFTVPVNRTFPLEDWRTALDLSQSQRAHGKLVLLP
jgi:NADPH:quinone reductase-like Zn-dependent oxidoreductase